MTVVWTNANGVELGKLVAGDIDMIRAQLLVWLPALQEGDSIKIGLLSASSDWRLI